MSEHNEIPNLKETKKEKKRNVWSTDIDIGRKYGLNYLETTLFCHIERLQDIDDGFCRAKNYYFIDQLLGVSEDWVRRSLLKLQNIGIIFVHYYNTKHGKRRQIVTASSIKDYQAYLNRTKQFSLLKRFKEEFVVLKTFIDNPNPDPKTQPSDIQPPLKLRDGQESHTEPPRKLRDGPPRKLRDANNTTYYPNSKNDGTCKTAESAAVPFSDLKKELSSVFSKEDVNFGIGWFELQTAEKIKSMDKPIACIINAIKKGYAKELVIANSQVFQETEAKKEEVIHEKKKIENDYETNKKISESFSRIFEPLLGFTSKIDSARFLIKNESLERKKASGEYGISYYDMPNGKKRYGAQAAESIEFSLSPGVFITRVVDFVEENKWMESEEVLKVLREGGCYDRI